MSLTLLLLPTAVVAVDMNVLFLTLPDLTTDLDASATEQLWIVDVYGLVVGVLAVAAGAIGDRIGRRRLLLAGCAGFLSASLLAAFSPSVEALLVARILQGVAGATLMPSTLALIGDLFEDPTGRARAIGTWAACQFAFASFGPAVGGVLLHWFWWGSVFLLAVPVCVVVLVLGRRLLPESRPSGDDTSCVDALSAGLLIGALVGLFTAIKAVIPGTALPWPVAVAVLALAGGSAAAFSVRQRRMPVPFLDLALLRRPVIAASVISLAMVAVVLAGTGFWVTQTLQTVVALDPLRAAIAFMPMGLGIAAGTLLAPLFANRVPAARLVPLGLAVAAVGALALLAAAPDRLLVPMLVAITVTAFGCGPLFAFGTHRVVSGAPRAAAGRAAALAETSNHLGSAVGLALVGTVASTTFLLALQGTAAEPGPGVTTMADAAPSATDPAAHAAVGVAAAEALHAVGLLGAVVLLGCAALDVAVQRRERAYARLRGTPDPSRR
ncbi:MFS transporter [Mumia flava]|uniref:MFS transporter n=1 Tax=Mumia flava TaxID=1348852 RepID=UPI000AFD4805|nr:MFS transporter [Mumia flava]